MKKLNSVETYQGSLNHCKLQHSYENVVVLDFVSMYPSSLLSANMCYGTCGILTTKEWLASPTAQTLMTIPYRNHSEKNEWCSDA
ncbi:hypothetical protein AVEN_33801-1 [Araneus ventricosus]|uniref:DNA-directed DNA polymerase n=1 Tax=Araneus ventricosus TaxID=182803 RepID=A0A4Y2NRI4_ARAVE|nr:hypothetical protein AVEN_33801-1 [Araneus ventricosus]